MLSGQLKEVVPEAQYQGTVYTKSVIVALENGQTIELFDTTVPISSDDDIGQQASLEVTALPPKSLERRSTDTTPGIRPTGDGFEIAGDVVDTKSDAEGEIIAIELDVGFGTVSVSMSEYEGKEMDDLGIGEGDPVSIETVRLDVTDIETA